VSLSAEVETAYSFVDLLTQTEDEREELDMYIGDPPVPEVAASMWDLTEKVILIANATWVARLIDSEMLATIERYLNETSLVVRRNAFAGTVTLATPGVLGGLRDKVLKEQRENLTRSEGRFSTVTSKTYEEMVREGLVHWTVRTAADEGYEVRQCPQCAKWFEPLLKARSRFCSPKCRKGFNNLSTSSHEANNFECAECDDCCSMQEFSGLRFESDAQKGATPLRITHYSHRSKEQCCVECVRTKYKEWRRYIAPMETLGERASS
jgi:hypothetical protein